MLYSRSVFSTGFVSDLKYFNRAEEH